MTDFDPRITPARDDLAADFLRSVIEAPAYVKGEPRVVAVATAPMFGQPDTTSPRTTELLLGEPFTVYDRAGGWAWGQAGLDDYVGYVPEAALAEAGAAPTHKVSVLRTFVYAEPDLKAPVTGAMSLGARAVLGAQDGDYTEWAGQGWVFSGHMQPVDTVEPDYLTTAVRFMGVPYLWGGRTSLGVDCSGLVQLALQAAGIAAPRDTDMQATALGEEVGAERLQQGDLVFFPGHVGIMIDPVTILHANAWEMMVSPHPLNYVVSEIAKKESQPIVAVRRIASAA